MKQLLLFSFKNFGRTTIIQKDNKLKPLEKKVPNGQLCLFKTASDCNNSRRKKSLFKNKIKINCYYCDIPLTYQQATVEHLIPRAWGGTNDRSNTVIACGPCNHNRGNYSHIEWKNIFILKNKNIYNNYKLIVKHLTNNNRLIERKYLYE